MVQATSARGAGSAPALRRARRALLAGLAAGALLLAGALPASAKGSDKFGEESDRLAAGLLTAVATTAQFGTLVDFSADNGAAPAQPAAFLPNVDTAVIELRADGQLAGAANVLYDRDSPQGYRVRIDRDSLATKGVEFARWRQERWDDQAAWTAGPAPADVTVPASDPAKRYMSAYPASVLKVMVAHTIYRLIDQQQLTLDTALRYHEDLSVKAGDPGRTCGYGPSQLAPNHYPQADGATDTVASWLDQMITVSDNFATCVLLQAINDRGALQAANQHFQDLGLTSLRMQPEFPVVGNGWSSGTMSMGALDTAKLMLLASGAPGTLWLDPKGQPVTADVLSAASRAHYQALLADQSFNEVLNPVNLCGSPDSASGIPSTVPQRWVDPATGKVVTYDGDLAIDFGFDTRPCNEAAQVTFAHKTGLTYNAGSDTGIVRALPGQDGRWYVVATLSNIGNRFGDADWARSKPNACEGAPYVCYPRGFGRLGRAIDDLVKARPATAR